MFETLELGRKIPKKQYEEELPRLRADLLQVQNELAENEKFSVAIVIAGVEGAGKGSTVNILHEWMDPRFLEAHAFGQPTTEEFERPWMWRFWRILPPVGRVGIFFGSWYTDAIVNRVKGLTTDVQLDAALSHIKSFERALVDDRTLLLKFWFHLSKKDQGKRLKKLSADPLQCWRVGERDWKFFELYDDFVPVCERVIRETNTGECPWTMIEGTDARYRHLTVGKHVLEALTRRMEKPTPPPPSPPSAPKTEREITILDTVDLSLKIEEKPYKKALDEQWARLGPLSRAARDAGVPAVVVFEGWDAAGKGGAIRRLTRGLDARYYRIVPIAAPTDEELARHYLWRFWRHLPRAGRMTIFDRSWYGRVLVERVEHFAHEEEWRRAYHEINEFEELLRNSGTVVAKFWMHIDPDEQQRRFEERERTSFKKFKITEDDYRNRERQCEYEIAVEEMVERTSTEFAPWTIVEANDKRYARVKVLRTMCDRLEQALGGPIPVAAADKNGRKKKDKEKKQKKRDD